MIEAKTAILVTTPTVAMFLHLELGVCAVLARSLRVHSLAHGGFAQVHHTKTNTMSVFALLRQPCAVLARSLRAQGF